MLPFLLLIPSLFSSISFFAAIRFLPNLRQFPYAFTQSYRNGCIDLVAGNHKNHRVANWFLSRNGQVWTTSIRTQLISGRLRGDSDFDR